MISRVGGWVGTCVALGASVRRQLHGRGTVVPGVVVLSVGGLRMGGVGKSVVARALADLAVDQGHGTAVVLRGHGGSLAGPHAVMPGDQAVDVGDEAVEHAAVAAGRWRVVVARQRVQGVVLARSLGCTAVVLDDGFQHRAVARDLDLVMVTRPDATAAVMPVGPLREPLDALAHADLVATVDSTPVNTLGGHTVHPCEVTLAGFKTREGVLEPITRWQGARLLVVTGIARPGRVTDLLTRHGLTVIEHRELPDHGVFPPGSMTPGTGIDAVLVTAKDAARGVLHHAPATHPVRVVHVAAVLPGSVTRPVCRILHGDPSPGTPG